jgi:hypothetical protein
MNQDSYQSMLATIQAFHDKHDFKNNGGEDLAYRVALMAEELGEISIFTAIVFKIVFVMKSLYCGKH